MALSAGIGLRGMMRARGVGCRVASGIRWRGGAPREGACGTGQRRCSRLAATRDFSEYKLNINTAVDKEYEASSFSEIAGAPVTAIQGVADRGAEALKTMGVKTVRDLGEWKFYRWAKAIVALAEKEAEGGRAEGAPMNIDRLVIKAYEKKSLKDIAAAPVHALQGISERMEDGLGTIFIKTVEDLANNKFATWCEAISTFADYERVE